MFIGIIIQESEHSRKCLDQVSGMFRFAALKSVSIRVQLGDVKSVASNYDGRTYLLISMKKLKSLKLLIEILIIYLQLVIIYHTQLNERLTFQVFILFCLSAEVLTQGVLSDRTLNFGLFANELHINIWQVQVYRCESLFYNLITLLGLDYDIMYADILFPVHLFLLILFNL